MEKTITGKVSAVNDTEQRISIGIEISPMVKATETTPAKPAVSVLLVCNDPKLLRGPVVGDTVTVVIK